MGDMAVTGSTPGGAAQFNPEMEEIVKTLVMDLMQEDIFSAADNLLGESES